VLCRNICCHTDTWLHHYCCLCTRCFQGS